MGDTGVEAVVRMATTTPALNTLVLGSAYACCVSGRGILGGWAECLCLCLCLYHWVPLSDFRLRHDGGGGEVCGVVAGRKPAPTGAVDLQ